MKTYKDIDIKYYDNDGNIHVRCSVPVTQDALVHYELMQSHYCKLSFKLTKPTYFLLGDFIDTPYGRFELIDLIKAKDNDTIGYSYEIQFDAYYRKLKNKILKYRPNTGSQEATFSLTSKISTHVEVIMKSLAYYAKLDKSYLYDPKFEGEGTDYTYVIDASVDANAAKLITYSNTSMLDAIANIAQTFECEWWFEGNILHFGTCENTNAIVDFRLNDNIVSMSSSQSQSTYANRVYAFGAARNLPSGYKNDADADITKDGVVEKRLMLPTSAECSDKNKQLLAENGFELKNGYIQVGGLHEDQYVEGVTTNDDIYPRNLIKTSKVTSYEKDVEDESTPEEGDYIKRTFYRVNSLTIVNDDGEKTGDMAFRKAYILSGKNLHIVFQSGSLNGMDFECEFNPDGVSEILRDNDGNPILKYGKEQINPKSQVFEIVANEDYGRFLPDTALHPKDGDTFVLYNWDSTKLGDTLVSAASNELLTDAIKNLKKSMIDPTTYTCTAEANYSFSQGRGNFHGVGDRVNLYNKGYDDSYRSSRIIGYELNLDIPYDGAKYYVGEKPSYSRLNAMESKIEELVYNGQSYLNGNGGGGKSIYIIKSYDKTAPTDYNVYSAKAVDEQRLNKLKDDTAKGTITWEKVQKLLSGLLIGNSNNENGGSWTPDAEGRSHLITDYLEVRMKAIFEELVINKTSTIGGKEIISPAGGVVAHKVEEVTVTYNNVSQKAYRCYFLAEQDGDKIDNDFVVEDQVRSESFNLNAGKYHKTGNHFFWRLAIGRDEEPVELEGKKYHYIDLSETDCATGSDVPMKGDVLSQCGNRSDPMRQSCLVFSSVDTYSPSISLYHGINSYSFANREYVEYGVNKQTNKAFFHVYGDMYFGDRPTSANNYEGDSYVKYDSDKKKVTIKGDLDIKSTYDGKTLDKYIADKSLDKNAVETIIKKSETIIDLQNQIDGAIETWFYDGVPTLKNEPAVGWDTDMMKNHLGDLYYDNKTGKAYRFAKDGSTYKWIIITDTELTKALEDSSQALKDAKSKRRIFGSQPVPPYDVNDMWVNATYPSDGSTYKNEILKCSTSKAEGEEFDIADWKLASKYTDDTKAEEAKKAAEKAQAEIKDTQTNLIALGTTVSNNKKAFDAFTSDGYLDSSEIAAIAQDSKRLEDDYNAAVESYNNVVGSKFLLDKDGKETTYKTDLVSAKATLDSAKNELITYLSDIVSRYNASDSNEKATIKAAAAQKYTNFTNAYKAFYDKLGVANNYITSNLFDGLNTKLITNMAGLEYIKAALVDGDTVVKGGLILSTLIALRNDKGNVTAGINGADTKENGIALWLGGKAIDKQASTTTEEEKKIAAKSLLRFDGTGYFANGNLWWDADGTLHADPTSFIINKNNVGVQLALFAPVWKSGTTDTTKLANVLSIDPQKPFTHLDVSGNVTTEGSLKIGGIYLSYDSTNNALRLSKDAAGKEAANFYALGGITAYGKGAGTSGGGGGLNGSVKSYSNALKLTSESLNEIASAYSIKALDSRISSLEGGSATAISVSGSGNAVTSVTKNGTTISVVKGATFLTSHQSLDGYVNAISVSGSGNAITSVSKSGKGITFTKGATFLTSHQSLANYYTKSSVDSLLSGKSATSHTHSVKINGVTKTIAATGGTAVDLGTYLTSHQSLANYVTTTDSRLSDSRYPKFANRTWYLVGYDAYIGDHNLSGYFCVKSANDSTRVGISLWNRAENDYANIWFDNTNINLDKQLVMNNKRIWIQGVGTAGGNNNRLTLVAGMPSGLAYNTSCRGTILYSNGIAFADPYNGKSNNDSGWIRHLETSGNSGTLEIAVGDDASNEEIHFRWYDTTPTSEHIRYDITVPRATGTLALTSQIPTSLKSPNSLSWSGYNTGSYDGSSPKSFVIPSNTNQLTNGAGFITSSASISGNAATATNADKLDGIHANGLLTAISNSDKGISITVGGTTKSVSNISVNYASSAGNADTVDGYHESSFLRYRGEYGDASVTKDGVGVYGWAHTNEGHNNFHESYGDIINIQGYSTWRTRFDIGTSGRIRIMHGINTTTATQVGYLAYLHDNVASATKLQTARTIWGQSFDGTGNVNGTIYINNNNSSNGAIRLNNDINSNARISAIDNQVIFNTGAAIRFGETAWDWNQWAGLKYNHSYKIIYLGIADGSAFNANNAQSEGTLRLAGIKTVTPDSGARIGNTGGDLYLGNNNNSAWVKVQDMCSQQNSNNWRIYQAGGAVFNTLTINGGSTFNGAVKVNNMLTAKAIMFTTTDANAFGTDINNWDGSIGANVTNMFNGIPQDNIQVEYSMDNGASWNTYPGNPESRFNLVNDNTRVFNYYLGCNNMLGDTEADKLAQIKKNQLRVTVKIPAEIYQELSWISVDVNNGVDIKCQVYFGSSTGGYKEYVSKIMLGWAHKCDICVGPLNVNVGNDTYRYVRLVFSHPSNNTALRNGIVAKIRALALTKYIYNNGRYTFSTTGHIYDYDAYMNTYFPNSILAAGGVTAYKSSDVRLKTNITKLNCLNVIKSIGGTYEFDYLRDHKHSIGFIAQHVNNPLLKDIVAKDKDGYLKINYWSPKLISLAFGALTEIDDEVDRLKARVRELETEVEYLKNKDYALQ
jgi:hypothetical protein|nr:MAG TPA_asm: tail protein [Caudoviricetes sp.]